MPDVRVAIIVLSGLATVVSGCLIVYRSPIARYMAFVVALWVRRDPLFALCVMLGYICAAGILLSFVVDMPGWLDMAIGIPTMIVGCICTVRQLRRKKQLDKEMRACKLRIDVLEDEISNRSDQGHD